MKNSISNVQERRSELLKIVNKKGSMSVEDLAEKLNVSEITIRRDLKILSEMGVIGWRSGVATSTYGKSLSSTSLDVNASSRVDQIKMKIAAAVPSFISESSTIFVNSSTLCWMAINQLASKRLTIITNNAHATESVHHPQTIIILTGGEIRYPKESLVGGVAIQLLSSMQSDYTIIGLDGVSVDGGLTTQNLYESQVNTTMIKRTKKKVICLADYRKIGVTSNYHVADIDDIDILITDSFANEKVIKSFRKRGIEVIQIQLGQ
ncbi:lactose transport regulator [Companilactobacillus paralimentarius DSM 13238 = JCM 10415]|uniref:Lactose phosphotransferase system repressor n=1 Tax=Companilactobacillus paralimentarius DSM 13238 = JCM 10415 TaxID=1122151 RepID=A0A0R1PIZ0_9LACO|nr:DeoR/GlpR family DNA-binding transcription regulator [Companilactobacillus paralimentarius]KAE9563837.1 DeoR family transcriptional regulator [Companilactobacillus paralimentarius]KRL32423.1 lactose transport regulator [Companilactobacillus paralimentarius DSM 13238 = JCM 10415]MDR4932873.1 DeoR/GlpR family DNA-binding transcription regulator [Companilactobacillus paralimentarius]QFR69418.1 DeoR family transcriptional regulator [Companilactobacillus paralimentarius]